MLFKNTVIIYFYFNDKSLNFKKKYDKVFLYSNDVIALANLIMPHPTKLIMKTKGRKVIYKVYE